MTRCIGRTLVGISLALLASAACTPTPTATLRPTPTRTPQLFRTVIVTLPTRTVPPTWTPPPTRTPPPTLTPAPSSTPRPTRTAIPSRTPIVGEPGVITAEGLLTVQFTPAEIDRAVKAQLPSVFFSSAINTTSAIELDFRQIRVTINFNDFTTEGVPADFTFAPRAFDGKLVIDVGTARAARSTLTNTQIETARLLLNYTLAEVMLPEAVRRFAPRSTSFAAIAVLVEPTRLLVTVKPDYSTPTPTP